MRGQMAALLLVSGSLVIGANDPAVPFPEGYRHWTFLHSSMVSPKYSAFGKQPCEKPCTARGSSVSTPMTRRRPGCATVPMKTGQSSLGKCWNFPATKTAAEKKVNGEWWG
jgi:hypothetical protein